MRTQSSWSWAMERRTSSWGSCAKATASVMSTSVVCLRALIFDNTVERKAESCCQSVALSALLCRASPVIMRSHGPQDPDCAIVIKDALRPALEVTSRALQEVLLFTPSPAPTLAYSRFHQRGWSEVKGPRGGTDCGML